MSVILPHDGRIFMSQKMAFRAHLSCLSCWAPNLDFTARCCVPDILATTKNCRLRLRLRSSGGSQEFVVFAASRVVRILSKYAAEAIAYFSLTLMTPRRRGAPSHHTCLVFGVRRVDFQSQRPNTAITNFLSLPSLSLYLFTPPWQEA